MNQQLSLFAVLYEDFKINKPIRLIELFAGYGSQSFALKYLGVPFEHHKICEWAVPSIQAYKDAHFTDDDRNYSKDLTKEEVINYLFNKGISMDYNKPMKIEQIKRLGEEQVRTIYNNIVATNNLVNVQQVKGKDLDIVDIDKYCYILTYSFPCQDLSLAGLGKGMSRDGGTRSGMLWEVERILDECNEINSLPQVLLMENVPQVIGCNAISDFQEWRAKLESLGYSNYVEILNAKNYGIPQNRERCFMVSILGEYNYYFPFKVKLEKKLKDILEDKVDEKYYLSDKQLFQISNWNSYQNPLDKVLGTESVCPTITTRIAESQDGGINASMKVLCESSKNCINIREATKKGYKEAYEGDGIDISGRMGTHRGTVQSGMAQTIKTSIDVGVVVKDEYIGTYDYAQSKTLRPTEESRTHIGNDISGTILASGNNNGIINNNLRIRKLTPKECFRLMGVKDEDFENIAKNQSNSKLYHLAGDSIVVNVLMGIFKQVL